jgi:hypothetical protein
MNLVDAMAGRTVRCSGCGGELLVPAATTNSPATAAKRKPTAPVTPAIEVSPAIICTAVIGVALLVVVLVIYFGPWAVSQQWADMSRQANAQVTDVVQFALQAYESENGMYDPSGQHAPPMVQGEAAFVPPAMAFSMPRRIIFTGKTSQGNYIGTYDTTTGEVAADIEIGGFTVGGLVDVKKASGKFQGRKGRGRGRWPAPQNSYATPAGKVSSVSGLAAPSAMHDSHTRAPLRVAANQSRRRHTLSAESLSDFD